MKNCVPLLLFLSLVSMVGAQTALSYGAKMGFNLAQHYGTKVVDEGFGVETGMRPGLSAGAWLDLEILPNFALGYELIYTMKGSKEKITFTTIEIDGEEQEKDLCIIASDQHYGASICGLSQKSSKDYG